MRNMCWVRDVWCEALEEYYVEYYCKATGYRITKPKAQHAPICFYECDEAKRERPERRQNGN
jgi:hypothetical protein